VQTTAVVPRFENKASFELPLVFSYDHEVAATKYACALGPDGGGTIPLLFLFSGTTFYRDPDGRIQK
jgi:hypothetical protein